jgi:integrase
VNLEIGTLRSIMRRHRVWAGLQPDVRMLKTRDDIGKALSQEDEKRLLHPCAQSRSTSLLPAVLIALNTGMRSEELRFLTWDRVDLERRTATVGRSKTEAGTGRTMPLNNKAAKVLAFWAEQFPDRQSEHFVFPSERYGAGGNSFERVAFDTNPKKPIGPFKDSWDTARTTAKVNVRFHDLRHTLVTRRLEGGVPLSVVASILGWSPATTARRAKRYGHIGQAAQRQAVALLDRKPKKARQPKRTRGRHKNGHSPKSQPDQPPVTN